MNIIDFDARFTEVLNKWIEENRHRFRRPEDMEDEVPDVSLRWLNTPADWLEGCTPGEYFDRFSDSAQLCALLCGYIREGVPVPDPLLDRLAELGDDATLTGFNQQEIDSLTNDIDSLIDGDTVDEELRAIEELFNVSLTFDKADQEELKAFVKDYGKEALVEVIIQKAKGEI